MSFSWRDKRVVVTGGAGFIGSAVVRNLIQQRNVPPSNIVVLRSSDCDLRQPENAVRALEGSDVVIHLAAPTGGIAFSRKYPASQFRDCTLINLNVLEAARLAHVQKFVGLGNILTYPHSAPNPLEESSLHNGRVAETHLGIGTAKRDMVIMVEMYHREYGLDAVSVLSANAYGPGDRFDPEVSHVIPATILKCHRNEPLLVWGDGKATRDFIFVDDLAEGILRAAERLSAPNYYVNLSGNCEVSIADLVHLIAKLCDFKNQIVFDSSKPGGDLRRGANGQLARQLLSFEPATDLQTGMRQTIAAYRNNSAVAKATAKS